MPASNCSYCIWHPKRLAIALWVLSRFWRRIWVKLGCEGNCKNKTTRYRVRYIYLYRYLKTINRPKKIRFCGSPHLVRRRSQMAGLHTGCVVFEVAPGVIVVDGEVVGMTQGVSGTCHCPAESEQLSTCPFGERQSLVWELSQVPGKKGTRMKPRHLQSSRTAVTGHTYSTSWIVSHHIHSQLYY